MVDFRKQQFVLARLGDYCDYRSRIRETERDPVLYMWEKLKELDAPLQKLKQEVYESSAAAYFWKFKRGGPAEAETADFKQLLDAYLSAGDFADARFQLLDLTPLTNDEERFKSAVDFFRGLRVHRLLDEEDKPPDRQNAEWKRILQDLMHRLNFDLLEKIVAHKPMSPRRMCFILRRLRRDTAEYCAVLHFPRHDSDVFTPFIIPRVEALIAGNRRVLKLLRRPHAPA